MIDTSAALAFSALGHPSRVAVLRLLVQAGAGGLSVSQMRDHLKIPATTFGHHLKAMAEANLIKQSKQGRTLVSVANYAALQGLVGFLMEDCCRGVFSSSPSNSIQMEPS